MPSLYAHHRFGEQILPRLPADIRGTIARHRAMFDSGLQGPDFLFFYKPSSKNPIRALAGAIHRQSGREYFTHICRELRIDSDEEILAYLFGLLGHYCLDSVCHPFIRSRTGSDSHKHNAMESEFERYLLARDGVKKPHTYPRSRLTRLNQHQCGLIRSFYEPAAGEEIFVAAQSQRLFISLLTCSNGLHRAIAGAVVQSLGEDTMGLIIPPKPDPEFSADNEPLLALFDQALERYPQLMDRLRDHLTFREPLSEGFDAIFG